MRRLQILLASVMLATVVSSAHPQTKGSAAQVEFVFTAAENDFNQELPDAAKRCVARHEPFEKSDAARVADDCLKESESYLTSWGYLRAEIRELARQTTERGLMVRALVKEGNQYSLGRVSIVGNKVLTAEHLTSLLRLRSNEIANARIISEWLNDRVRIAYADAGHLEYSHTLEPRFVTSATGEETGIVDLNIDIREGRRFVVRRIEFLGNATIRDNLLRRALVIEEGDQYSERLFEKSIHKLNELGLFERLDGERDVDFRYTGGDGNSKAAGEGAFVDLNIRVKELKR